jgi:hypothetical protein
MSIETLPEKVRQSTLALALEGKLSVQQPVIFDHWGEFKRLRERVAAHMRQMQELFPQFTPHDEEYHLARLFGIADKMLGRERYAQMNAAELFLIACGLYAHDWGMAVGLDEISYLRTGGKTAVNNDVFVPLDDEVDRLRDFVDKQGLRAPTEGGFPGLNDDYLRSYVRHTHAWRSGVRVRAFFNAAGASVPQALERVCQGHWLDFSELDDELRFPTQFGVLGYTVNLRAIALYVRLVDLFDIADDRTPFAIWRFVAPRDPRAQMEWHKHRALGPVTFPTYGDGRAVRFDGSTADPEVWAELEDLRRYCENQLAGTNDLLARHGDERHQLDLRKVEWAVVPERFKPINIRFEFHRRRMFEILADEIYQGDSHVFLRELLQNSIDAIRMRRELVRRSTASSGVRRDVGLGFDDAIYFSVQHRGDGGAIVHCRDFGVGMDEYIVRNYLAVAGVSYYQSDEFRYLGLRMDPISRFGIGILSCFMVAERIEIETFRDPRLATGAKPLCFDIPAVDLQFRCYPGKVGAEVGTGVTVHVLATKLKSDRQLKEWDNKPSQAKRLYVADYLAAVAGFVEFPIVVDEEGIRKVILHPHRSATEAQQFSRDGEKIEVRQLSRDYPWDKLVVPQDAAVAAQHFRVRSFDLCSDLRLQDHEGWVSYVTPKEEAQKFELGRDSLEIECQVEGKRGLVEVRLIDYLSRESKFAPSIRRSPALGVYRDGVLVADPPHSRVESYARYNWPRPILLVNLPKQVTGSLDVTRRTLKDTSEIWDLNIWRQVANSLRDKEFSQALREEPPTRLDRLARLACFYWLNVEELVELVPAEFWPGPVLNESGEVVITDLPLKLEQTFWPVPQQLMDSDIRWLLSQYWRGEQAVVLSKSYVVGRLQELWISLTESRLRQRLVSLGVRFLKAPLPGLAPLLQVEGVLIEPSKVDETTLWERATLDPNSLTLAQRCAIQNSRMSMLQLGVPYGADAQVANSWRVLQALPFSAPFSSRFAWGESYFNILHPTAHALFRCAAALRWCGQVGKKSESDLGRIYDCLSAAIDALELPSAYLDSQLTQLWDLVRRHNLFDLPQEPPRLEASDYVWGSTVSYLTRIPRINKTSESTENRFLEYWRPFGQVLTTATSEELPDTLRSIARLA